MVRKHIRQTDSQEPSRLCLYAKISVEESAMLAYFAGAGQPDAC